MGLFLFQSLLFDTPLLLPVFSILSCSLSFVISHLCLSASHLVSEPQRARVVLLAAGVFEGGGQAGGRVVAGVGDRELVVELRHVGHDEELVWAGAPHLQRQFVFSNTHWLRHLSSHHVVSVQQLRDPKLLLRQGEGQQTVPETKIYLPFHFLSIILQRTMNSEHVKIFLF